MSLSPSFNIPGVVLVWLLSHLHNRVPVQKRKELEMPVLSHPSERWEKTEGRDKGVDHNTPSSVSQPKFPSGDGVFTKVFFGGGGGVAGRPVRRRLK